MGYIEFGVIDIDAPRAFYQSSFSWEFNDYCPAYSGIKSADRYGEVGGIDPAAPPSQDGTSGVYSDVQPSHLEFP